MFAKHFLLLIKKWFLDDQYQQQEGIKHCLTIQCMVDPMGYKLYLGILCGT